MPILVPDAKLFRRILAGRPAIGAKQVWPWFHPAIPWSELDHEATIKQSMFTLPVHHSLHESELERIVKTIDAVF